MSMKASFDRLKETILYYSKNLSLKSYKEINKKLMIHAYLMLNGGLQRIPTHK